MSAHTILLRPAEFNIPEDIFLFRQLITNSVRTIIDCPSFGSVFSALLQLAPSDPLLGATRLEAFHAACLSLTPKGALGVLFNSTRWTVKRWRQEIAFFLREISGNANITEVTFAAFLKMPVQFHDAEWSDAIATEFFAHFQYIALLLILPCAHPFARVFTIENISYDRTFNELPRATTPARSSTPLAAARPPTTPAADAAILAAVAAALGPLLGPLTTAVGSLTARIDTLEATSRPRSPIPAPTTAPTIVSASSAALSTTSAPTTAPTTASAPSPALPSATTRLLPGTPLLTTSTPTSPSHGRRVHRDSDSDSNSLDDSLDDESSTSYSGSSTLQSVPRVLTSLSELWYNKTGTGTDACYSLKVPPPPLGRVAQAMRNKELVLALFTGVLIRVFNDKKKTKPLPYSWKIVHGPFHDPDNRSSFNTPVKILFPQSYPQLKQHITECYALVTELPAEDVSRHILVDVMMFMAELDVIVSAYLRPETCIVTYAHIFYFYNSLMLITWATQGFPLELARRFLADHLPAILQRPQRPQDLLDACVFLGLYCPICLTLGHKLICFSCYSSGKLGSAGGATGSTSQPRILYKANQVKYITAFELFYKSDAKYASMPINAVHGEFRSGPTFKTQFPSGRSATAYFDPNSAADVAKLQASRSASHTSTSAPKQSFESLILSYMTNQSALLPTSSLY